MNNSASLLRVASLQTPLVWEDPTANAEAIGRKIDALEEPCDLIVLPEMWATGFTMDPGTHACVLPRGWQNDEATWPAPLAAMRQWAQDRDAAVIGSLSCRDEAIAHPVNRCFFVPPNGPVEFYDKRHLFTLAGEDAAYGPGKDRVIIEWRSWRILLQVCYDLRFPQLFRAQAMAGAETMAAGGQSGCLYKYEGRNVSECVSAHKAPITVLAFIPAAKNAAGGDGDRLFSGGMDAAVKIWGPNLEPMATLDLMALGDSLGREVLSLSVSETSVSATSDSGALPDRSN